MRTIKSVKKNNEMINRLNKTEEESKPDLAGTSFMIYFSSNEKFVLKFFVFVTYILILQHMACILQFLN